MILLSYRLTEDLDELYFDNVPFEASGSCRLTVDLDELYWSSMSISSSLVAG